MQPPHRPPQYPQYYYPRAFYPAYAPQPHYQQQQQPHYVPQRRSPQKGTGLGCIGWFFITVIGGGVLLMGGALIIVAFVAAASEDDETATVTPTPTTTATAATDGQTQNVGNPTVTGTAKGGNTIAAQGKVREVESAFTVGRCSGPDERRRNEYQLERNSGAARRLHGKVAALHLRLGLRKAGWTPGGEVRVDHGALASARFLLEEGQRHGVTDLKVDPIPWTLTSPYELPTLQLQSNELLTTEVMHQIEADARTALETALASSLDSIATEMQGKGYDQVAFAVYFPAEIKVRDWASPAWRGTPGKRAELCFIFSPMTSDFGAFAVVITHETLHLFGADDLYRIKNIDADDRGDLMDIYCSGFAHTHVGEATSYSIGWRTTPPDRAYAFRDY